MTWQAAFDAVVLERLRNDQASVEAWSTDDYGRFNELSGRGQLRAGDGWRAALWGAFRYQRYHADAFREALRRSRYRRPQRDRVVMDLGCGGGTVAIAYWELLAEVENDIKFDYIGWDHNTEALALGDALLGHPSLAATGQAHAFLDDLDDTIARTRRLIRDGRHLTVTMSYVLRQDALDDTAVAAMAKACAAVATEAAASGTTARLLITDSTWGGGGTRYPALRRFLSEGLVLNEAIQQEAFAVPRRYPNLYPQTEGWFVNRAAEPTIEQWFVDMRPK
jgi:SAM-dependent methyltransferase